MANTFKTTGIVLRSLKYSETSLILDIYTQQKGIQSFIVSGVRKSKSKLTNVFHPMNIIDLVAYENDNGLSRIKEAQFHYQYNLLYSDVIRSTIGMFIVDLSRNLIKEKEPNEELYLTISEFLKAADNKEASLSFMPIRFCLEMASIFGFAINNNYSSELSHFDLMAGQFIKDDFRSPHCITQDLSFLLHNIILGNDPQSSREQRSLLLDHMIKFFRLHIEGFNTLKSLPVIRTILS